MQRLFDVYEAQPDDIPELKRWLNKKNKKPTVSGEKEFILIARFQGMLAGCIQLIYFGEMRPQMPHYWLYALIVKPLFRSMGCGEKLFRCAIAFAEQRQFNTLHLLVNPENSQALNIYRKSGFEMDHDLAFSWNNNYQILTYKKGAKNG
ncbi:MAG: GNAT family N-acetyltransferase [candidate division KSB1 bacterium]|nr:GNAT family N-acetyltransferase [candidate division KSB1 bacterium]